LEVPARLEVTALLRYMEYRGIKSVPLVVAPSHNGRIDSGLMRLVEAYPVGVIAGPDDAFVLEQLSIAARGVTVYSSAHATIGALDRLSITVDGESGGIFLDAGGAKIHKRREDLPDNKAIIEILDGGVLSLPSRVTPVFEPVGKAIYGETRILLGRR